MFEGFWPLGRVHGLIFYDMSVAKFGVLTSVYEKRQESVESKPSNSAVFVGHLEFLNE